MRHARSAPGFTLFLVALALLSGSCRGLLDPTTSSRPFGGGGFPGSGGRGGVYTMTNATSGNAIVAFARSADSTLTPLGTFPTGGTGTGGAIDPLQSQNSLLLDPSHRFLFAVDAGSDEVTSFRVNSDATLSLASHVSSGGDMPVSLAFSGGLLFVLNAGDGRVEGFHVNSDGSLDSLGGTSLAAGAAGASTIAFSSNGQWLIVTERAANRLELLAVRRNGTLVAPIVAPSSGAAPFAVTTTPSGLVVVTEVQGAAPDGAVSTYRIAGGRANLVAGMGGGSTGALDVITASLDAGGTATCWVVVSRTGTAYVVNSGSNAIATMRVSGSGRLTLLDATAVQLPVGSAPTDVALSSDERRLFVLEAGTGSIAVIDVSRGTPVLLTEVAAGTGASGMQGLAAF